MFKWDNGLLTIQKIDVPKINMNVMQPLQESYLKFLTDTVYKDMRFLVDELRTIQGLEKIDLDVRVGGLVRQTFTRTQVNKGRYYYPVMGTFLLEGKKVGHDMELLRIPYMDDYGKINVMGASKVVLSVQRSSEDISYSVKENLFNISMPYANVRIYATKKAVKLSYGSTKIPMEDVIAAMLHEIGSADNVCEIFGNSYLLNSFKSTEYTLNEFVHARLTKQTNLLDKFKSVQYELGLTRDSLNETFSLYRAVGETLSRAVLNYNEGEVITEDMVKTLVKQRVGIVYVKSYNITPGYHLANEIPVKLSTIPKGFKNCALLRMEVPDYAQYEYIPEDVTLRKPIMILAGMELTDTVAEFLQNMGVSCIDVTAGNSKKVMSYSFEREIASNYTARLKELIDNIPAGRYADEWVYYYNNPELRRTDMTHLTPHDMIAVLSAIGQIVMTGESFILNRDSSFLKKILLINEIFSENLRNAITAYVKHYASSIASKILSVSSDNAFYGLTKEWMKQMNAARVLAPADTINLAAEISQVCHVNTLLAANAEIPDDLRQLAMPYYGRLCPFETPAGKKLGLVNTRALGVKIQNGLPLAPYRKVLKTANGIRISNNVTYLSVKEELGHVFGDLLSLKQDKDGNYLNTKVIARIPNPDAKDDPFMYTTISAFDLAGGYVDAYPEQFLSPTAALVPMAGSDDAVRISYGLSQMRQVVYQQNSEIPLVRTDMYEDMFSYAESQKFYANCDGTVLDINNLTAHIREDVTGEVKTVPMQIGDYTGSLDMTVDVIAHVGEHVRNGDIIAEGHKYPQPFVVRAPFSGTISKIRDNCIEITKKTSETGFINLDDVDVIAFENGRIMGQSAVFMNVEVSVGDYVRKGDIIATTSASRNGIYSPSRNELVAYVFDGYNYEDGVSITERATVDFTTLVVHSTDKKIYKKQFPHATARELGGFNYCTEGDVIGKIVTQDEVNAKRQREELVKADFQCTGIPFEHTTIDDTSDYREYRWYLLDLNQCHRGDKMAGRHGNKGTGSYIRPNSKALMTKNGLTVNINLNPAGLPSRMNLAQVSADAHLTLIAHILGIHVKSNSYNGATIEDIKMLMRFTYDLANTAAIGNVGEEKSRSAFDSICAKYPEIPTGMKEHCWVRLDDIIDWRGAFNEAGDAILYDHESGTWLENPTTIGFSYFQKLEQEDYTKLSYRYGPLEEQYSRITSQPQKGDNSNNGQRIAEMELMALTAYGASEVISEVLNESADNTGARDNVYMERLDIDYRVPDKGCTPRATENFLYFLEALGVKCEVDPDIVDVSASATAQKIQYNLRKAIHKKYYTGSDSQRKFGTLNNMTVEDFADISDFFDMKGLS